MFADGLRGNKSLTELECACPAPVPTTPAETGRCQALACTRFLGSLLHVHLGEGADNIVSAAMEMPQLKTLCGLQPEQADLDFSNKDSRDPGDVKLLAFDVSRSSTIKTLKCA